ncbi:hypothetical protein DSCW_32650 [Desulfosarcina widdelii]|uniref:Resolvase/invertase-type recombinase catalytic domain-containing protein n=1 Tax=Desulfosarcina widdelii TaxID=947919 RepID=A0A5K7Z4D5_9BACT|nr:recombinase family protein [Desulfosarcina widdelii]BBO75848.1 hypothetical protein DSCW_32650 [Desulfosarcina widdelii]
MPAKILRFAPLVRVSTEGQAQRGESLRTQKDEIIRAVKALGGTLIDDPWRYSGQEHATATFERKKLDQLLKDAARDRFDAVIVCDASRWSRDNGKSKQGLDTLRKAGVRFFAGQSEYDLYKPADTLFLGMATEINEFVALEQTRKSINNRIARAKRGVPTSGKLPYGRTFDKETETWGIDEEKQKKIVWAAEQYLQGESIQKLAAALDMNHVNLWKILTKRSGDKWEVRYRAKRVAIDETVPIQIPRLLSPETIKKIKKRAAANKTYYHGQYKYKYLLSRVIFCADCGNAMFGQTNRAITSYYRHPRGRKVECDPGFWVRADEIETAVFFKLFALAGDSPGLEAALARAIPDTAKIDSLLAQRQTLQKELKTANAEKENIVKAIGKGILSDDEAAERMTAIRKQIESLKSAIDSIEAQTQGVPTRTQIKKQATLAKRMLESVFNRPGRIAKMTFEEKCKLVHTFFDGHDAEGKRLGVYVRKNEDGQVSYSIRGVLGGLEGLLRQGGIDPIEFAEETGLPVEFSQEVYDSLSQCDAYYR